MNPALKSQIAETSGSAVVRTGRLSGGCVGEVYEVALGDGRTVVAKVDVGSTPLLDIEGYMLAYLSEHSALPVPKVLHSSPALLVMSRIAGASRFDRRSESHAADLLSELHGITQARFGLSRDTLIGGLPQSNREHHDWVTFFAEERLLDMGRQAIAAGRMEAATLHRLEALAGKLPELLPAPESPSLLHGDVWTSNVLAEDGAITGFIDPAIYYGHPEIELAFITLFNTFGSGFFDRYHERRPIAPGFFEERRDLYNLYPLLVHVTLFGGGYLASVEATLSRFGV